MQFGIGFNLEYCLALRINLGVEMKVLLMFPLLIAGLPWTAWLLWFASVGIGLAIVLVFYFKFR